MTTIRLGVAILPEDRWDVAAPMWRHAEELGFDHAWTYDHLAWRSLRDDPWFTAVPILAAAALATSTIRIGPLVASPNFRHPVPFARDLIALDDISSGRVIAGLGAGGEGWDAVMLGHPAWSKTERAERFAEFVTLLDLLLRQPATTWSGRYYAADGARSHPGCVQQPRVPFAIASAGPRGMRLAAEYGATWVTTGDRKGDPVTGEPLAFGPGAECVRRQITRLDEACAAVGRDPNTIDRLVLLGPSLETGLQSVDAFEETKAAYAEAGATDLVVPWPRASEPYAGDPAILDRIMA